MYLFEHSKWVIFFQCFFLEFCFLKIIHNFIYFPWKKCKYRRQRISCTELSKCQKVEKSCITIFHQEGAKNKFLTCYIFLNLNLHVVCKRILHEMASDIIAPESFRHSVRQRYQMFLWLFDKNFRENAKNRHFLMQNVQTDNDFW